MYTAVPKNGSPFDPGATSLGLHVWQVEQLRPVEVPKTTLGIFFSGDAYLVLHNGTEEQAHFHLWMGEHGDEQGACALLCTQLSSLLGEHPVTHCEVQGKESDLFMDYFPCGLTCQGSMASAFKHTHPGPNPAPKLYRVKGKRKIRVSQRGSSWASFNPGDCFLLDLGQTLFVWCGAWSNVLGHSRVQELAAAIWGSEWGGKARLEVVADGKELAEMVQVLGPKPALQEGSPEEDMVADHSNIGAAVLYKVSDATGYTDLTQVAASSPFSQSLLCPDDCFVLDNGAGCKANEQKCQAALRVAEEVTAHMGHPSQTQVEILPQGHETPFFKQFFASWKSAAGAHGAVPNPECDQACASCANSQQWLHSVQLSLLLCHPCPFAHSLPMLLAFTSFCITSLLSHTKPMPSLLL
uniref:Capping actin protein, gelsolin like n=1 Tax=Cyanoderma ruficeps TaxID=181631 RepID=A0A8C3XBL2_9PASS